MRQRLISTARTKPPVMGMAELNGVSSNAHRVDWDPIKVFSLGLVRVAL